MNTAAATENLSYDVFVNEWPQQTNSFFPNGEPKRFSPQASTLIYGSESAVLTDPGMTADQAHALGDLVAEKGRNVTDIFVTHAHGDHWFAAGLLAERFGARVVATAGTIAQMHQSVATRPFLWDKDPMQARRAEEMLPCPGFALPSIGDNDGRPDREQLTARRSP